MHNYISVTALTQSDLSSSSEMSVPKDKPLLCKNSSTLMYVYNFLKTLISGFYVNLMTHVPTHTHTHMHTHTPPQLGRILLNIKQ